MSGFAQPESDSEDELPPGWEERATLGKLPPQKIQNAQKNPCKDGEKSVIQMVEQYSGF
jgi:hypothetical protein